jgi:hypothetical protein
MKTTILLLTILLLFSVKSEYVSSLDVELSQLKERLKQCDSAYRINIKALDSVIEENRNWNNHAVRMQMIAGVKNPDTIFTWIIDPQIRSNYE